MNEQYDFEYHLSYYKELYMLEGLTEDEAEEISIRLMKACNIDTESFYEEYSRNRKVVH